MNSLFDFHCQFHILCKKIYLINLTKALDQNDFFCGVGAVVNMVDIRLPDHGFKDRTFDLNGIK